MGTSMDKGLGNFDAGTEFFQGSFESFGYGNGADGSDPFVFEEIEWLAFAGEDIFQMDRSVGALDDFRGAVVAADALDEFVVRFSGAFGD